MGVTSLLSGLFSSSQTASSSANGISPGSDILTTNFNGYKSTLDSLVAFANPSSGVGQFFVPTGMISPFAGPSLVTPPAGWLFCDGSAVARAGTYADLFSLISTTYGVGDGSSTFNLPDLRGRTLIGVGTAASGASLSGVLGVVQGASGTVLTNANIPEHSHDLQNHTHGGTTNGESNGHAHGFNDTYTTFSSAGPQLGTGTTYSRFNFAYAIESDTTAPNNVGHTHTFGTGGPSTNNSGPYGAASPTAVTAVQPSFPLNYIIKY